MSLSTITKGPLVNNGVTIYCQTINNDTINTNNFNSNAVSTTTLNVSGTSNMNNIIAQNLDLSTISCDVITNRPPGSLEVNIGGGNLELNVASPDNINMNADTINQTCKDLNVFSTGGNIFLSSNGKITLSTNTINTPFLSQGILSVDGSQNFVTNDIIIAYGYYPPIYANFVNLVSIQNPLAFYQRIGNVVHVTFTADISTTISANTQFDLSLPVVRTDPFINDFYATGSGLRRRVSITYAFDPVSVASTTGTFNFVTIFFYAGDTGLLRTTIQFSYDLFN